MILIFAKSSHFIYRIPLESFNQMSRAYMHYFHRYPNFLPFKELSEPDSLTEKFNKHQLLRDSDIPDHVMESCKADRGDLKFDSLWSFIGQMKDHAENPFLFPRLWKILRLILTIPHSNAEEKRVFSIVRKNKTCFGPRLDPEETLVGIVAVKLAMKSESVETFNIPQEVLTAAKSATYKYKLSHL